MKQLIIYDTSNFVDFPIGGQLTSIRNFLAYVSECQKELCPVIILVGLTTNRSLLGKKTMVTINDAAFAFIPVVYRERELKEVKNSLRAAYLKGLFKYKKLIPHGKNVIHYLHTPEAFLQIKTCHPFDRIVVFSHGSFFNMVEGFRFFQNNGIVGTCFEIFIKCMLRKADLIFVLDEVSLKQYVKYNDNVVIVNNSIILPDGDHTNKKIHHPVRLLFVGRLSKIKCVDEIIKAVEEYKEEISLTIVGDGEEKDYLKSVAQTDRVQFKGAMKPEQVKEEMIASDILVMNSVFEGKPMAVLEAMSYGLPVITTDVGGISELVKFGENAIKTNGKKEHIEDGIICIINNYSSFSKKAIDGSKEFDYTEVNSIILDRIFHQL